MHRVGPRLLKLSASVVTKSITCFVRKCLSSGIFPATWKQAMVTPVYKEDIITIAQFPFWQRLSKLVEKFSHKHLTLYLNYFEVIHQSQSGFRKIHSIETALLLKTETWLKALKAGKIVGTVLVDFRKAFDLVNHNSLLQKLSYYKCSDHFLKLMKSYLSNREQVVGLNNKLSQKGLVTCGVPQVPS